MKAPVGVGVAITPLPVGLVVPETVGVSLDDLVSATLSNPIQSPGVVLSSKASGGGTPPQAAGVELVQAKIDLTQTTYAISASKTGTWANEANSVGANNGSFATNANSVTASASGILTMNFAAQVNKTDLVISSVTFYKYWKYTAGLVGAGSWTIEYSTNGGVNWTVMFSGGAGSSFDESVNPGLFDLTAVIGQDWSKLSNFKVRVTFSAGTSATPSTISVDAMKLVVVASKTDIL
jgi:hypothetical protein